jgi:WD40 repeat protein/tetratricopeptide (TPR) repeat protein
LRSYDGGYSLFIYLLRRWVREHKPLDRVRDEINRVNPLANSLYEGGYGYYRKGEPEEATTLLRRAVANNPNHSNARMLLAQIFVEQNQIADAVTELEQAYRYAPERAHYALIGALIRRAEELERAEQNEDALAVCRRVLEISPAERTAIEMRARIMVGLGDTALKADALEDALRWYEEAGSSSRATEVRGRIRRRALDILEVESVTAEDREDWQTAIALCEKIKELDPENAAWDQRLQELIAMREVARRYAEGVAFVSDADWKPAQRALADVVYHSPAYKDAAELLWKAVLFARAPQSDPPKPPSPKERRKSVSHGSSSVDASDRLPPVPAKSEQNVNARRKPPDIVTPGMVHKPESPSLKQEGSRGVLSSLPHGGVVSSVAIHGSVAATAGIDGTVLLWDLDAEGPPRALSHRRAVGSIGFSPNGDFLIVGCARGLYIWDRTNRRQSPTLVREVEFSAAISAIAFDPTGTHLGVGLSDGSIAVLITHKVDGLNLAGQGRGHAHRVTSLAFSPASLKERPLVADTLVLDIDTGAAVALNGTPPSPVRTRRNERHSMGGAFATASEDGQVSVWSCALVEQIKLVHRLPVTAVAVADAVTIATATRDGKIRVRNLQATELKSDFDIGRKVTGLTFLTPGLLAASSFDNNVRIFSLMTGLETDRLDCGSAVTSITYSEERGLILAGCDTGQAFLLDINHLTGTENGREQ